MQLTPKTTLKNRLQVQRQGRSLAQGQGLAEYALILGLVSVVVIVGLSLLGPAIGNTFSNVVSTLDSTAPAVADAGSSETTGAASGDTTGSTETTGSTGTSGTGSDTSTGSTSGGTSGGTTGTGSDGGTTIGAGTGDPSGGTGDTSAPDEDGDGIADSEDNCPAIANASQADSDADGLGNACDATPNGDDDADGVDDLTDNCPGLANPDQADTDGDRLGDACDPTPNGDRDGDGVDDLLDNCPDMANGSQTDTDTDGLGDACDPTPNGDPVAHFYNVATTSGGSDAAGHSWQGIGTDGFTADGRVRTNRIRSGIGGTNDDFIYERMAYASSGDLHWSTSGLPDGTYSVRLYFADDNASNPSRFHINVQGGAVEVSNFSPVEAGGGASQAASVTLNGVAVSGGTLTLDLVRVDNTPLISAIAITN